MTTAAAGHTNGSFLQSGTSTGRRKKEVCRGTQSSKLPASSPGTPGCLAHM